LQARKKQAEIEKATAQECIDHFAGLNLDQLKNKLGSAVVALVLVKENKISVVAGVTPNYSAKIKANELVNRITLPFGGKGGGRAELAEGGGSLSAEKDLEALQKILNSVYDWVKEKL